MRWSNPSHYRTTGVHHLYSTAPATPNDIPVDIGPTRRVWWTRLDPGGFIVPHTDAPPWHTRWHYPIEPAGTTWTPHTSGTPTEPFLIEHWQPHAVYNTDPQPRIHLIADLDHQPDHLPKNEGGLILTPHHIPQLEHLRNQT